MRDDKPKPVKRRARPSSRSVKVADVARLAGVSTGSVSRALNEPHKVSARVRSAVLKAVAELDWVPHGAGKALASLRTKTIGAIIPTLANPNLANTMNALQQRLMEAGYILLIGCSEYDPEQAFVQARKMVERGIDGLVLLGENYPEPLWALVTKQRIPYVVTYGFQRASRHPSVGFDNYRAFVRLTNYVLDLGHRRIAMIAQHPANNDRAAARLAGTLDTLRGKKIELLPGHLTEREWTLAEGRAGLRDILQAAPRPTAVICANDFLAVGAILESQALGLDVPRDLSIVGCDDAEISAHLSPGLTTLRVPTAEIGRLTADHLLGKVSGASPVSVELDLELIVRASAAPPLCASAPA
jgi:LacI family transcriptional regulator